MIGEKVGRTEEQKRLGFSVYKEKRRGGSREVWRKKEKKNRLCRLWKKGRTLSKKSPASGKEGGGVGRRPQIGEKKSSVERWSAGGSWEWEYQER